MSGWSTSVTFFIVSFIDSCPSSSCIEPSNAEPSNVKPSNEGDSAERLVERMGGGQRPAPGQQQGQPLFSGRLRKGLGDDPAHLADLLRPETAGGHGGSAHAETRRDRRRAAITGNAVLVGRDADPRKQV